MLVVTVNSPGELGYINDLIHDRPFDVESVSYSADRKELCVPFDPTVSPSFFRRRVKEHTESSRLIINRVTQYELVETEGIGIYDFNVLKYDDTSAQLHILTVVPLMFSAAVDSIDIRVESGGEDAAGNDEEHAPQED